MTEGTVRTNAQTTQWVRHPETNPQGVLGPCHKAADGRSTALSSRCQKEQDGLQREQHLAALCLRSKNALRPGDLQRGYS